MALELRCEEKSSFIDHHEEELLDIAYDESLYPQMKWLWDCFYDSPIISCDAANDFVHELIALRSAFAKNESKLYLLATIDKLLPLFSYAYKQKKPVKCFSD